jgi:hypothetical protein
VEENLPASTAVLIRQRLRLVGHFPEPVTIEALRWLGDGYEVIQSGASKIHQGWTIAP